MIDVYHEGKEIGDDHECESEDEANDSTAPGMRVEVVVHVREQLFDVVPLRNAFALEELLAVRNLWKNKTGFHTNISST
jgi:hypothetical protein